MNLNTLLLSQEALQELLQTDIKSSTAFALRGIIKKVANNVDDFNEVNKSLFDKYGADKEGKLTIEDGNEEAYQAEYLELLEKEVDLGITKLTQEDMEGATLPTALLLKLDWLFEE